MKAVLTADQFTKFQAMEDHHGKRGIDKSIFNNKTSILNCIKRNNS